MNALEIVLLVAGIICIIVSFFIGPDSESEQKEAEINLSLLEEQKQHIRDEIDKLIEEQLEAISDQTEGALERLSNKKIMELGEYADTVFAQINSSHNEVMFLYDMLNEKTKDVKTTVKTINETKKQVEKLSVDKEEQNIATEKTTTDKKSSGRSTVKNSKSAKATDNTNSIDAGAANNTAASEGKVELENPKPARRTKKTPEETRAKKILTMSKKGIDPKDIAKELGIGIGEVNLVIGLNKHN